MLKIVDVGTIATIKDGTKENNNSTLIASSVLCTNGDILLAYNSGIDLSPGQFVGLMRSSDLGKTWIKNDFKIHSIFSNGGIESGCTLTKLKNGRILLPYSDGYYLYPEDYGNVERRSFFGCAYSDDDGVTWTKPEMEGHKELENYVYSKVIEFPEKDILVMPMWGSDTTSTLWQSRVYRSYDKGETWTDSVTIDPDFCDETTLVKLPNSNKMLAVIRNHKNLQKIKKMYHKNVDKCDQYFAKTTAESSFHITTSSNCGKSWKEIQTTNIAGTAASLHITPKGKLIIGFRTKTSPSNKCVIYSSKNQGKSWKKEFYLKPLTGSWRWGGYPSFLNLPDGRIFVSFMNSKPGNGGLFFNILEECEKES